MLPNFLCIGSQKAGTTSLYNLLKQHPDIYLSEKELHFFNKQTEFNRGKSYYERYFDQYNGELIIGEFTPDYSIYSFCPKRIKETLGTNVKFLFLIRQPVLRAYSQFNHYKVLGAETTESFEDVLNISKLEINADEYISWDEPKYYVGRGLYYQQLKRYIKEFGKDNILTICFEDLISNKELELKKIEKFLGVRKYSNLTLKNNNQTQIPKSDFAKKLLYLSRRSYSKKIINVLKLIIPNSLFERIKVNFFNKMRNLPDKLEEDKVIQLTNTYFIDDIKKLERELNRDLSKWYKPSEVD